MHKRQIININITSKYVIVYLQSAANTKFNINMNEIGEL